MDSHIDQAITSSFLRLGFKIRAFLKSEFHEDFKMTKIALLDVSRAEKLKKC